MWSARRVNLFERNTVAPVQFSPSRTVRERGHWWTAILRAASFACAVGVAVALAPGQVRADSTDDAFEVFSHVVRAAGVPIGPLEVGIIKAIVRCAAESKPVVNCARREIVLLLPREARPLADCVLNGDPQNIGPCAGDHVLQRLNLPQEARSIVVCMRNRSDIGECGAQMALTGTPRQAFDLIAKLKADDRSQLVAPEGSAAISNIIGVAEGIRDGNWVKVAVHAGPELYKAAVKIVLKAVLPGLIPASIAIDPLIDVIVDSRADLARKLLVGAQRRDARLIGETLTEFYLMEGFLLPCHLPFIPIEVRDAVCGPVGEIIRRITGVAGDVIDSALEVIKSALKLGAAFWNELLSIFGLNRSCEMPDSYYARIYPACYQQGALKQINRPGLLDDWVGFLNAGCVKYYRDHDCRSVPQRCNPQHVMFKTHVIQLALGLERGARMFSSSFEDFARDKGAATCDENRFVREYIDKCTDALSKKFPIPGDSTREDCWNTRATVVKTAQKAACEKEMAQVDTHRILRRVCRPPVLPGAPTGCYVPMANIYGFCKKVEIQCDKPLPGASEYYLQSDHGAGLNAELVLHESARISASYIASGDYIGQVCARNPEAGAVCSEGFPMTLRPWEPSCDNATVGPTPTPVHCGTGYYPCKGGCVQVGSPCNFKD